VPRVFPPPAGEVSPEGTEGESEAPSPQSPAGEGAEGVSSPSGGGVPGGDGGGEGTPPPPNLPPPGSRARNTAPPVTGFLPRRGRCPRRGRRGRARPPPNLPPPRLRRLSPRWGEKQSPQHRAACHGFPPPAGEVSPEGTEGEKAHRARRTAARGAAPGLQVEARGLVTRFGAGGYGLPLHLGELGLSGHLLAEERSLDPVEEPFEPSDELGLCHTQL